MTDVPGPSDLVRRCLAEGLGTVFLLAAVVGSGIMGDRLSGGITAIALLANSAATGAALVALILIFAPLSGAHFNPAVTLFEAFRRSLPWRDVPGYVLAQVIGAFAGVALAHTMFHEALFAASSHVRAGPSQALSEFVATTGFLLVAGSASRMPPGMAPVAVGAYIANAFWFTASTSFANPAVTLARAATPTFAGIRPADLPLFIAAQVAAIAITTVLFRRLLPSPKPG